MADVENLMIQDAENAQRAVLDLILKYPKFPSGFTADNKTVRWNRIETTTSIGIFPLQGSMYLKKYISGSYTAQMPFQIVFRSSPGTNKASIDAQLVLEELSKWLEERCVEFKDKHMTLDSIVRTSPVFTAAQDEKTVDYAVNMQLKYQYIK